MCLHCVHNGRRPRGPSLAVADELGRRLGRIVLPFVSTDTIGSEIISLYEGGTGFSHVDAVLPDGLLGARANQIGSVPGGVQLRPPDYEPFTQRLVVELPSCGEIESKWETFLRLQIGKPYDLRAILGFALPGDWHERGAFICSAHAGYITGQSILIDGGGYPGTF